MMNDMQGVDAGHTCAIVEIGQQPEGWEINEGVRCAGHQRSILHCAKLPYARAD